MGLDLQPRSPLNSVQMPAKEAERNRPTATQSYLHFQIAPHGRPGPPAAWILAETDSPSPCGGAMVPQRDGAMISFIDETQVTAATAFGSNRGASE
jgi:hypothetical protein